MNSMRHATLPLLFVAACSGESVTAKPGSAPTYHQEVAPVLAENCLVCHRDGGIAPISFEDYETARAWAPLIKAATASRTMPPWIVSDRSDCQSYAHSRALRDDEIALLGAWADAGAPEGEPAAPPATPEPTDLDDPSVILDAGADYTPRADLEDDYRCFVVDPAVAGDRFLTAYQVHPDAVEEVHHVVLYAIDSDAEEAKAHELDAAEDGPGYTCFGGAGTGGGRVLAVWTPGTGATRYPAGTGLRLFAGRELVMQIHYNRPTRADRSSIALELASAVAAEAILTSVADPSLSLPPGQASVKQTAAWPVPPLAAPVKLRGVYPHMHRLGTKLRVFWDRGADSTCLVDVPRYDFDWQEFFFYEDAITLAPPGGGHLRIECEFDTRDATAPVHFGEGTGDEMCIAAFYATY
jgi:hypothetical protein